MQKSPYINITNPFHEWILPFFSSVIFHGVAGSREPLLRCDALLFTRFTTSLYCCTLSFILGWTKLNSCWCRKRDFVCACGSTLSKVNFNKKTYHFFLLSELVKKFSNSIVKGPTPPLPSSPAPLLKQDLPFRREKSTSSSPIETKT